MEKIKDNKKIMIVKNKINDYYIINKTEKRKIITDGNGSYIILRPHDNFKITEEEANNLCIK